MSVYAVKYEDVQDIYDVYVKLSKEQKRDKAAQSILAIFSVTTALASAAIYKSLLPGRIRTGITTGTAIVATLAFSVFAYSRFVNPEVKKRSQLLDFLKPVLEQDFADAIEPARKLVAEKYWDAKKWSGNSSQHPHFYTVFVADKYSSAELQSIHQAFMLLAIDQQTHKNAFERANSGNRCNEMISNCDKRYTLFKGLSTTADLNRTNTIFEQDRARIPRELFKNQLGKNSSN